MNHIVVYGAVASLLLIQSMTTIAALFVDSKGVYSGLPGVDLWDEQRDARFYSGPHPVVAHPPCTRWCRLSAFVEARFGYKRGEDGGCFEAAINAVRTYGGVLEHPAFSAAWNAYDINAPPSHGGWVNADFIGGWTCYVEQWRYGHRAKKATWLYAYGVELPSLRWGLTLDRDVEALVSWCGNHTVREYLLDQNGRGVKRPRLSKNEASATPIAFRDALIAMARSVRESKAALCGDVQDDE